MKGSVSLNPKFTSFNLKNVKVLKTDPLIASDQKHLYFKANNKDDTPVKCVRWQDKNVINCTYLKKYKIILALCQNYRVYALTENLQEITNIPGWQSKYSLAFQFIQQYGILLMIGAETIEIMRISIDTNIKKTKFLSSMKFSIKKIMTQPILANVTLPWNKGYGINVLQNLLYVWSPESVSFLQLSTLQLLSQSHSLTKKQHPISNVYFSHHFKYTLMGTACGQIRVWRLPLSKRFQHENVLIHTFQAHVKPIKQIVQSKYSQKIIMTSGEDLLVCVWTLQTFEMLRRFQFLGIYTEVYVKTVDLAYVVKDNTLGQLNFGQSLQFITEVNSNILMVNKQVVNNQNCSIALTLEQNLGVILKTELLLKAKDLNKIQMKYIYPPLKAKAIKQILSSPFIETAYYLLAENGELFKVTVPPFTKEFIGVSSKIDQVYNIQFISDREKHPLNQLPCVIQFLQLLPPEFDSEIRQVDDAAKSYRSQIPQKKLNFTQSIQKFNEIKLMTIGCQKGSIIFVSCSNMSKIYCRLTYHRQKITFIKCVKQFKSFELDPLNGMIVSFCAQNYLKLIKFDFQKSTASCILTYYAGEQVKMLRSFQTFLTVVFYKGQFQVCEVDLKGKSEELCCRRSSVIQNHQGQILSIDYQQKNELIMTAGTDNRIKLWTTKKILLYDIVLDQGLSYSFFLSHTPVKIQQNISENIQKKNQKNNEQKLTDPVQIKLRQLMKRPKLQPVSFDIVLLHGQKLLYFHHVPLSFRPNQIQNYNTNPELLDDQKITLREVFQNYTQKPFQEEFNSPKVQKKEQFKINKKQRIQTEPSKQVQKRFFTQQSIINEESSFNKLTPLKKLQMKTQISLDRSYQSTKRQLQPLVIRTQKKKVKSNKNVTDRQQKQAYKSMLQRPSLISQSSIQATKKHLKQLSWLKQQINVNHPLLPKISKKKQDIFDQFMNEKLINKSVLTRRDITINRIIMKNIIKEHFEQQSKMVGLRLDY